MLVLARVEVLGWKITAAAVETFHHENVVGDPHQLQPESAAANQFLTFVWHGHRVPRLDKFASAAHGFK
jgi:hypothetical protein